MKIGDAYMYKHANNIDLMIGKEFIGTSYNLCHLKSKHNLNYCFSLISGVLSIFTVRVLSQLYDDLY